LRPHEIDGICPVICHEDSPTNMLSRFDGLRQCPTPSLRSTTASNESSSPEGGSNGMVRAKVFASAAAYRSELFHESVSVGAQTPPSGNAKRSGNEEDSLLRMLDKPSPMNAPVTLTRQITLSVAPPGSAGASLSPRNEVCPATVCDDSWHSVEIVDEPPHDCPDTLIEEDSCDGDSPLVTAAALDVASSCTVLPGAFKMASAAPTANSSPVRLPSPKHTLQLRAAKGGRWKVTGRGDAETSVVFSLISTKQRSHPASRLIHAQSACAPASKRRRLLRTTRNLQM